MKSWTLSAQTHLMAHRITYIQMAFVVISSFVWREMFITCGQNGILLPTLITEDQRDLVQFLYTVSLNYCTAGKEGVDGLGHFLF